MNPDRKIILASTSPRRREILSWLEIPFQSAAPDFEEISDQGLRVEEEVAVFSRGKALSLLDKFPDALIIGSDTLVALDQEKLGKPRDAADAKRMLRRLSGKTHRVLSGICVVDAKTGIRGESLCETLVRMKPLLDGEIDQYVATGEPMDKAGAYAVQGLAAPLIAGVEGDYFNVVGLPLRALAMILLEFDVPMPVHWDDVYRRKRPD